MNDYQHQLTDARRSALWRDCETMRQSEQRHSGAYQSPGKTPPVRTPSRLQLDVERGPLYVPQGGKRWDQVAFSAIIVVIAGAAGIVIGAIVAWLGAMK